MAFGEGFQDNSGVPFGMYTVLAICLADILGSLDLVGCKVGTVLELSEGSKLAETVITLRNALVNLTGSGVTMATKEDITFRQSQ